MVSNHPPHWPLRTPPDAYDPDGVGVTGGMHDNSSGTLPLPVHQDNTKAYDPDGVGVTGGLHEPTPDGGTKILKEIIADRQNGVSGGTGFTR